MKTATINAHFPELVSHKCYATGKGKGSTLKVAIARAVQDLLRQPNVKGQRYTTIKMTVSISNGEATAVSS